MSHFKNFLKFFAKSGNSLEDIKPLTEYLKSNNNFQRASLKIHHTKESVKNKLVSSFDDLLKEEDGLKMIEDQNKKGNNKN